MKSMWMFPRMGFYKETKVQQNIRAETASIRLFAFYVRLMLDKMQAFRYQKKYHYLFLDKENFFSKEDKCMHTGTVVGVHSCNCFICQFALDFLKQILHNSINLPFLSLDWNQTTHICELSA